MEKDQVDKDDDEDAPLPTGFNDFKQRVLGAFRATRQTSLPVESLLSEVFARRKNI